MIKIEIQTNLANTVANIYDLATFLEPWLCFFR